MQCFLLAKEVFEKLFMPVSKKNWKGGGQNGIYITFSGCNLGFCTTTLTASGM
jgi:hypothetical protein